MVLKIIFLKKTGALYVTCVYMLAKIEKASKLTTSVETLERARPRARSLYEWIR